MKFSKESMDVFKNFASINMSILFRPGKIQKTISGQKNVLGVAKIAEEFPKEVAIYDLNQFLGTASLFSDPEFTFNETSVSISDESGSEATFVYASKEAIVHAPDKEMVFPAPEVEFTLEEKSLMSGLKAASVMSLPNISLVGDGENVYITAQDANNSSAHKWKQRVGQANSKFQLNFRLELLKFLPRDYEVSISSKLLSRFESKKGDVTYFLAAESGSTFG